MCMSSVNIIVGDDGINVLQGGSGPDLIYGFDPNGPQGNVNGITATRVASGLPGVLYVTSAPGDFGRLFIVQQSGAIRVLDLNSGQLLATPFLNVAVNSSGERGLLGLAFDPDYASNGFFYIYRTVPGSPAHNQIERYHVSADPNVADPASATPILSLGNLTSATNHNAGWIGFGPDGYLYAATGDNANPANAQDINNLLGKIIRIDVHNDAFPSDPAKNYAILPDNMFVGAAGADEIFALGLRNPFRDSFDRGTGTFFIADVGQNTWEEIDIGTGGANYGWPVREGPDPGPAGSVTLGPGTLTPPIHSYNHSVGDAIIGGYVYRGPSDGLQGQLFFADFNGKIFTLRFDGTNWVATERTGQIQTNSGAINVPTSFGEDARGNLYITDIEGEVFRLTPVVVSADLGDTLKGFAGDDMMFGGAGADVLDGGSGDDTMVGGRGNDTYVVTSKYDALIENRGEGTDTVQSSISFTLAPNVENLLLTGSARLNGTGNGDANQITGNVNSNILAGLSGPDTLDGGQGTDTATYAASGAGVNVSLATGVISGGDAEGDTLVNIENLTGSKFSDVLEGNSANNVLAGAAGIDKVTYEHAGAGVSVNLAITRAQNTIGAGTDTLTQFANLTGSGFGDVLTGSSAANVLSGLGGDDRLNGGAGNDTLIGGNGADMLTGGAGKDTLTGGTGADIFVFGPAVAASADKLMDFEHGVDLLQFSAADYGLPVGPLDSGNLVFGTAATDPHPEFVYNAATLTLRWDPDGVGGLAPITVATFNSAITLTASDFVVV